MLTPADEAHHVDKWAFTVPFVCGATNLGEALRRISEGAAMIRSKGEAGTGNIVEAVRHLRSILGDIRKLTVADPAERYAWAKELQAPIDLVDEVAETGELPVPLFCAGGIATPADASLVMQLGAQAVFVGSGIFKSADPAPRAKAIVEATTHFRDAEIVAKVCRGLGEAMRGEEIDQPRRQAGGAGLVTDGGCPQVKVGVLALQGGFRPHVEALAALGADAVEVRLPRDLAAGRRPRPARRRVDDRRPSCSSTSGLFEPLGRAPGRRDARPRHLRRADPAGLRGPRRAARPAPFRRHRPHRAAQRLRPPGRLVRGST